MRLRCLPLASLPSFSNQPLGRCPLGPVAVMVRYQHESSGILAGRSCIVAPAGFPARWGRSGQVAASVGQHGTSVAGMPPPEVKRDSDHELVIFDGVTRATRVA